MSKPPPRSSRQRYRSFVDDYRHRRLDDALDGAVGLKRTEEASRPGENGRGSKLRFLPRGERRRHLREYLSWLRPHRVAIGVVFLLAVVRAGLEMVEPLFMRFIIDQVLLNTVLDAAARLTRLNAVGATFLGVIILSSLFNVLKDYRQKLLNRSNSDRLSDSMTCALSSFWR